jgi:hypothetical protein
MVVKQGKSQEVPPSPPLSPKRAFTTKRPLALPACGGGQRIAAAKLGRRCICELRRPGVTLHLLWEEHRAVHPDG